MTGLALLGDDDFFEYLYEKAETKDWYILITREIIEPIEKIEQAYYRSSPERRNDFNLAITPEGVAVAVAKKNRMSYKQLYAMVHNDIDKRTIQKYESLSEAEKKGKDIIPMLGWSENGNRLIMDFHMKFLNYTLQKQAEKSGLESVLGKECQWRYSLQAQYENRQDELCHNKPTRGNLGFKPNGQIAFMPLCQKHWDYLVPFLEKQPDIL
jgi:hypothetical protein